MSTKRKRKTFQVTVTEREEIVTNYIYRITAKSAEEAREIAEDMDRNDAYSKEIVDGELLETDVDAEEIAS